MDDAAFASLTPRERDCLRGVRALKGSGEIARELGIATGTVDAYLGTAKVKLGARDRKHAAMLFAEHEAGLAPQKPTPQNLAYENLGLAAASRHPSWSSAIEGDRLSPNLQDVVLGQRRFGDFPVRTTWSGTFREILEGARPSDLSTTTRGVLILAATVIIGFAFFVVSAGVGALYGLATLLRSLSH
ncbi:MAG: LuxR family transcriptional regulator [Sphingomonas sp.]|uniref:response regulator transcription factor n=1 Tax=Sphingomonas sp. TaxID=28214 RepID=UPI0012093F09|nr:helix-turn-helix transcriptional regulator [Sphingomonas sp.]THD34801.1 MAG: LuxR family transcriptional regulator [Sphingomonas sp.]